MLGTPFDLDDDAESPLPDGDMVLQFLFNIYDFEKVIATRVNER